MSLEIEAVITCVNYADFLEHTLPENLNQLDKVVVVTNHDDKLTQTLCNKYSVDVLTTNLFTIDGDKFNKARAINLGLSHLRRKNWVLHIDADVLLPHGFRSMLKQTRLDPTCLYGADRFNTKSYDNWLAHKEKIRPHHSWRFLLTPPEEFPMGSRLLHKEHGYCPIGYFQLWHGSTGRIYPMVNGSAEHDDVLFAVQWPIEKRVLLPEVFCYHLESEANQFGKNWEGRRTRKFGPCHPKPYCKS